MTLAVRRDGALAGVAPFFLWGFGGSPEVVRLSLLGAGITDYLGIIALPECAREVAGVVFERIADAHRWRVCDLQDLRHDSPLLRVQPRRGLYARDVPCNACPVLRLPKTADGLREGLSPKFRKNLRTAANRLQRRGTAGFVRAGEHDRNDWMNALFRLHRLRWNERHSSGMVAAEKVQIFHREVSRRFAWRGMLRLLGLRLNGEAIAVQYNFAAKGTTYYYLSGFNPAFADVSPGALLLQEVIAGAIAEGGGAVDFLRKREAYKYEWGARDQSTRRLLISRVSGVYPEAA
jgi:CelD/BcsL family acetyltransferase involved in cellulose biosynthesis